MNDTPQQTTAAPVGVKSDHHWRDRAIWGAILAALLAILFFSAVAFLPRWWAQRIADQVDRSNTSGILIGLFYGFTFTFVSLMVLRMSITRKHRAWKLRIALAILAILIASPNLLTLGIVMGNGNGAHAGQRILDTFAPAFRLDSLIGAVAAVLAFVLIQWLLFSRRRNKHRLDAMKDQLEARAAAEKKP
jgi:MFS family permease